MYNHKSHICLRRVRQAIPFNIVCGIVLNHLLSLQLATFDDCWLKYCGFRGQRSKVYIDPQMNVVFLISAGYAQTDTDWSVNTGSTCAASASDSTLKTSASLRQVFNFTLRNWRSFFKFILTVYYERAILVISCTFFVLYSIRFPVWVQVLVYL